MAPGGAPDVPGFLAMSYDLQVWSVEPVALPQALPEPTKWRAAGAAWTRAGRAWQIEVCGSSRALPEDLPAGVDAALPGIAHLAELGLEPSGAPESAYGLLLRTASALAKQAHGVVLDPQEGTLTTPRGVRRVQPLQAEESVTLLALSWWFARGPLVEAEAGELLETLEAVLPEALPRRYGRYVPLEYVAEETGREHLLAFIRANVRDSILLSPHPPVASTHLAIPERVGGTRIGFKCGFLELEIDAQALQQPGWKPALQRCWRRVSEVVRPFYGDVRTLRGHTRERGTYLSPPGADHHPVCSWWWAGIPHGPVHAAVLGAPYLELWPAFVGRAERAGELAFLGTEDWEAPGDALVRARPVPPGIAQPAPEGTHVDVARAYPAVWPFEAPRPPR